MAKTVVGDQLTKSIECPSPIHNRLRDEWATYRAAYAEWQKLAQAAGDQKPPPKPDQPRRWVPVAEPHLCGPCSSLLNLQLRELTELAPKYLADADGYPHDTREGERVNGSTDPASPSKPSDDLDELLRLLTDWEAALRGQPPLTPRGELAGSLDLVVSHILARFTSLLLRPDVVEFATADGGIASWHRYLTARTRAGRKSLLQPVRCDRCGERNLWWREGDVDAECRGFNGTCQRLISKTTIDGWVDAAYAQHAGELAAT